MDFFDNSHWWLTKFLLSCLGAWPFQRPLVCVVLRCLTIAAVLSILIPEILRLFTLHQNLNMMIECAPFLAFHFLTITKMSNCFSNGKQNQLILMQIHKHWHQNLSPADAKVLRDNASDTKKLTLLYVCYIYATTALYLIIPVVPKVLDVILPLNESRPGVLIYRTEYFVDPIENEFPILIHGYLISPFPSTVIVAFDALYCTCVNHACSMFEMDGQRLKRITSRIANTEEELDLLGRERIYDGLVDCVKKHRESLEFACLLQSKYGNCLLFVVFINMTALSITGCQTVLSTNDPGVMIQFGTYTIGQIVHLYFLSLPAQKMMDYSGNVHLSSYQGNWYNVPAKSQKLLILMMMRSRKPSALTAGKIYTMSATSFALVIMSMVFRAKKAAKGKFA